MVAFYVIKEYERAVVFRLGKITGEARGPGLIFVAPLMSTIAELGAFLGRESKAAAELRSTPDVTTNSTNGGLVPHGRHQPA
jgi:regulator of protease activity HflC (stomatin/prohibitin superfamily)